MIHVQTEKREHERGANFDYYDLKHFCFERKILMKTKSLGVFYSLEDSLEKYEIHGASIFLLFQGNIWMLPIISSEMSIAFMRSEIVKATCPF